MTKTAKQVRDEKAAEAERPRIALHKLSVMDSFALAELENDQGEIRILGALLEKGTLTEEQTERLIHLHSMEHQRESIRKRMEALAKYVEYVPRSWFVEGAPKDLALDNPDTYQYLQRHRFGELYRMLIGNASTEDLTGN